MRVATYQAHNVLKIADVDFNLEGRHLFLVGGKNDQGKTSALQGLLMALCGRSGMDYPEIALKEGEDEGWIKVQLLPDGDERGLSVELLFRRKRGGQVVESFRILDEEGRESPEPRSLLKRLYEVRAFDPLEFERLARAEKKALLQKLLGLDFSESERRYKEAFNERAAVNRDGKKLVAQLEAMPLHKDVPEEEVSVERLMNNRREMEAHNQRNERERQRLAELEAKYSAAQDVVSAVNDRMDEITDQIAALQAEFSRVNDQKQKDLSSLELAGLEVSTQRATWAVLENKDPAVVDAQILAAGDTNRRVRENAARKSVEAALAEMRAQYKALDDAMDQIKAEQEAALREAPWPVEGLSMDDDGVLFNGLPIEQAAKSRRIRTSVLIGMALNPKLRLLVCQDGNDLDVDSMAELEKILEEKDFQMILEMVTRGADDESRCAVVIEDGKQRSDDGGQPEVRPPGGLGAGETDPQGDHGGGAGATGRRGPGGAGQGDSGASGAGTGNGGGRKARPRRGAG
jgi:hypothetical protein